MDELPIEIQAAIKYLVSIIARHEIGVVEVDLAAASNDYRVAINVIAGGP